MRLGCGCGARRAESGRAIQVVGAVRGTGEGRRHARVLPGGGSGGSGSGGGTGRRGERVERLPRPRRETLTTARRIASLRRHASLRRLPPHHLPCGQSLACRGRPAHSPRAYPPLPSAPCAWRGRRPPPPSHAPAPPPPPCAAAPPLASPPPPAAVPPLARPPSRARPAQRQWLQPAGRSLRRPSSFQRRHSRGVIPGASGMHEGLSRWGSVPVRRGGSPDRRPWRRRPRRGRS